jgi:hypothetical protein
LPYFFHRFLQLKSQALEVSDEQAITQTIKALHTCQLHNHLVRECPKHWKSCMKSSASLAERWCYTSKCWANRESSQAKAQGHSSTTRAKKVHQASIHLTNKFTASTRMVVDHQKIGRKTLDLCEQKVRIGRMILVRTKAKPEVAMQTEAMAGVKHKTGSFIACSMKRTLTTKQETVPSSLSPRRK